MINNIFLMAYDPKHPEWDFDPDDVFLNCICVDNSYYTGSKRKVVQFSAPVNNRAWEPKLKLVKLT